MELFDFIDTLFSNEKYTDVPDSIKKKHFFMTQRFMSIKYPMEANSFNIIGINEIVAMDFWHMVLSKRFSRKPQFLFTKTIKSKEKDKIDKFSHKLINYYIKVVKMDRRDFEFAREIYPDELQQKLKNLEKTVKDNDIRL